MITRAASMLRHNLTQSTTIDSENYKMQSAKLQAYQILTREHRATTQLYERLIKDHGRPRDLKIVPFPTEYLNPS